MKRFLSLAVALVSLLVGGGVANAGTQSVHVTSAIPYSPTAVLFKINFTQPNGCFDTPTITIHYSCNNWCVEDTMTGTVDMTNHRVCINANVNIPFGTTTVSYFVTASWSGGAWTARDPAGAGSYDTYPPSTQLNSSQLGFYSSGGYPSAYWNDWDNCVYYSAYSNANSKLISFYVKDSCGNWVLADSATTNAFGTDYDLTNIFVMPTGVPSTYLHFKITTLIGGTPTTVGEYQFVGSNSWAIGPDPEPK